MVEYDIKMTLYLEPKAQMRVRHFAKITKTGNVFAKAYKDSEQGRYEDQLMQLLDQYRPEVPLDGPLIMGITVFLPIPQSKPQWWKEAAEQRIVFPDGRPDYDNLVKNIKDCMQKIGFYHNDSQVFGYDKPVKFYSINPRWEITLRKVWQPKSKKEYQDNFCQSLNVEQMVLDL